MGRSGRKPQRAPLAFQSTQLPQPQPPSESNHEYMNSNIYEMSAAQQQQPPPQRQDDDDITDLEYGGGGGGMGMGGMGGGRAASQRRPSSGSLGRQIGRFARRMSFGSMSAMTNDLGVGDGAGASNINLAALAALNFDGLDNEDGLDDGRLAQAQAQAQAQQTQAVEAGGQMLGGGGGRRSSDPTQYPSSRAAQSRSLSPSALIVKARVPRRGGRRHSVEGVCESQRRSPSSFLAGTEYPNMEEQPNDNNNHDPSNNAGDAVVIQTNFREHESSAAGRRWTINNCDQSVGSAVSIKSRASRGSLGRTARRAGKMVRRVSSGSLYHLGLTDDDGGGISSDSSYSDDGSDKPEPGDADYVPPLKPLPRNKSTNSLASTNLALDELLADSDGDGDDDAADHYHVSPPPPPLSRGGSGGRSRKKKKSSEPKVRVDPTLSAVNAIKNREYSMTNSNLDDSGVCCFDPDSIIVGGFCEDDELHMVEHVQKGRKRRRLMVFIVGGAVIAGVLVLAMVGFRDRAARGAGNVGVIGGASGDNKADVIPVREPPDDLGELCSIGSIATEDGHDQCEVACGEANCCMAAGSGSCYLQQQHVCQMYSACGTLHGKTEKASVDAADANADLYIPPPPPDLGDMCSDESLDTLSGHLSCASACHHGRCCVSSLTPPDEEDSLSDRTCRENHRDVCDSYGPCLALEGSSGHKSPAEMVEETCTVSSVATRQGRDGCEGLCHARSCCFAVDERNCRIDNKAWCEEYRACEVLIDLSGIPQQDVGSASDGVGADGSAPSNQAAVPRAEGCQESNIITHLDLLMCEESCDPALCCFDKGTQCPASGAIVCRDWEYCKPLVVNMLSKSSESVGTEASGANDTGMLADFPGGQDAVRGPTPLASACDEDNVKTPQGKEGCFVLCEDFMCCFNEGPGGCSNENKCTDYSPCKHLLESTSDTHGAVDQSFGIGDHTVNDEKEMPDVHTDPPHDLDSVCDPSNVGEDEGRSKCEASCTAGLCCLGIDGNCETNLRFCLLFAPCEIIWETDDAQDQDPKALCTDEKTATTQGRIACEDVCSDWSCCWSAKENCFDENASTCLKYMVCPDAR